MDWANEGAQDGMSRRFVLVRNGSLTPTSPHRFGQVPVVQVAA